MFAPLPKDTFDVIYADPPWRYKGGKGGIVSGSQAEHHYPTVNVSDLALLPVSEIAADNSLLFLWSRSPMLPEAIELGQRWGFKYITVAFVWDKQVPVIGRYTMSTVEQVLLFKRGLIPKPRGATNIRQFLSEKRGKHSTKPITIRDRIHEMFPTQKKIELFARYPSTEQWTTWGFEANERAL